MDKTEMNSLVNQLKAAGLTEEEIMDTFYATFQEGKMDRKDLEACANFMGYELTDDFKNDATPDPMSSPDLGDGITKEEAENAKEIKPGETAEGFKDSIETESEKSEDSEEDSKEDSKEDDSTDEDKEWEEVQKKFKW